MQWAFFVDANLEPAIAESLEAAGYRAEFSDYVLGPDADDEADILPYVRREELIVVTADLKDFAPLEESRHEGLFLLNQQRAPSFQVVDAILDVVDAYESPTRIDGSVEVLDAWLDG